MIEADYRLRVYTHEHVVERRRGEQSEVFSKLMVYRTVPLYL